MKNIDYDGELEANINASNDNYDYKGTIKKHLIMDLAIAAGLTAATFGFDWAPFNIGNLAICFGSFSCFEAACSYVLINGKKRQNAKNISDAEGELNALVSDLKKENVNVSKENVKDAVISIDGSTKLETFDANSKLTSKEEKVIKYFYLLDEEDQIRVLKQISNSVKINDETINSNELFLLEDEDLKDKEMPVHKVLRKEIK